MCSKRSNNKPANCNHLCNHTCHTQHTHTSATSSTPLVLMQEQILVRGYQWYTAGDMRHDSLTHQRNIINTYIEALLQRANEALPFTVLFIYVFSLLYITTHSLLYYTATIVYMSTHYCMLLHTHYCIIAYYYTLTIALLHTTTHSLLYSLLYITTHNTHLRNIIKPRVQQQHGLIRRRRRLP